MQHRTSSVSNSNDDGVNNSTFIESSTLVMKDAMQFATLANGKVATGAVKRMYACGTSCLHQVLGSDDEYDSRYDIQDLRRPYPFKREKVAVGIVKGRLERLSLRL